MGISCTVAMVFPSSGTLIFRLLARLVPRCQNGALSGRMAVSLSEVEDRATERAASFSDEVLGLEYPTGLFLAGQSWYFVGEDWLRFASEVLLVRMGREAVESLAAAVCKSFSEVDRWWA